MYLTDGSSHYSGILNEEKTIAVMQRLKLLSGQTKKLGGPRNKADWEDKGRLFSAKHKESLSKGSFDWVNTTRLGDCWSEYLEEFYKEAQELSERYTRPKSSTKLVEYTRNLFSELSNDILDAYPSEELKKFLYEHLVEPNRSIQCVITESGEQRLFIFPMTDHPAIKALNQGYEPSLEGAAEGSRKVVLTKGEDTIDSGLRLRIALNNGVRALIGLTTDARGRKKSSYVVAKIQQDNVRTLVEKSKAKVYHY